MIPGSASPFFLGSSLAAATSGGLQISRSLRFNSSDSAYLSRVIPSGTSTTFTASLWIKRSSISATYKHFLFTSNTANSGAGCGLGWTDGNAITVYNGAHNTTSAVYRDVSAWYYITLSVNAGTATLYVNGVQQVTGVTGFQLNGTAYIGTYITNNYYFDGYLANVHLIDGQALTPSSFTETDATTGQLIPKTYTGSYGTNGFNLLFADNSSNTASTLGKDTSGNSNNWTPNNLSVTAGAGNDSLVDVPTNGAQTDTGVGGEVRGNYATWNPLINFTNLTNGNLSVVQPSTTAGYRSSTIGMPSGKWYWEINVVKYSNTVFGVIKNPNNIVESSDGMGWRAAGGFFTTSGSVAGSLSLTTGDVLGLAFNADTAALSYYKNGSFVITTTSSADVGKTWFAASLDSGGGNSDHDVNFGQRAFAYQNPGTNRPSADYKALCTANLPAPLVTKPSTVMDVVTYTGNGGATKTVSGLAFSPDLVWTKARSQAYGQNWYDVIRGGGKVLRSDLTDAELTNSSEGYVSSFTSDGYVGTAGSNSAKNVNENGTSYVGWCWDAGSSTDPNNTQGSITSTVRANATAGFSIITYTGTGAAATVGHGLGVAPSLIIARPRNATSNWIVYHASEGAGKFLRLNTTDASTTDSTAWNNTAPTSSVYSVGNNAANGSGLSVVAYCFAPVVGYSSAFTYTGNGSSAGPFVYLGFRPRFFWVKRTDSAGDWWMYDAARNPYNVTNYATRANSSAAEVSDVGLDMLSNGFRYVNDTGAPNISGATYVGFAWAESPFQYARAR